MISVIIAIGWAVFWLYWIISAISTRNSGVVIGNGRQTWYYRITIVGIAVIAVRLSHNSSFSYGRGNLAINSEVVKVVGLILFSLGLIFAVWARIHLDKEWGMPMAKRTKTKLVTSGPYGYVRHPIYTGILIGLLGSALAISLYWLAPLIAGGSYFIYSATREEKYMLKKFPKDYPAYKKRTKMLIPYIL
jgi:protein-S-isoprenylcysteine O-methyltransferase Ste14